MVKYTFFESNVIKKVKKLNPDFKKVNYFPYF